MLTSMCVYRVASDSVGCNKSTAPFILDLKFSWCILCPSMVVSTSSSPDLQTCNLSTTMGDSGCGCEDVTAVSCIALVKSGAHSFITFLRASALERTVCTLLSTSYCWYQLPVFGTLAFEPSGLELAFLSLTYFTEAQTSLRVLLLQSASLDQLSKLVLISSSSLKS